MNRKEFSFSYKISRFFSHYIENTSQQQYKHPIETIYNNIDKLNQIRFQTIIFSLWCEGFVCYTHKNILLDDWQCDISKRDDSCKSFSHLGHWTHIIFYLHFTWNFCEKENFFIVLLYEIFSRKLAHKQEHFPLD